VLPVAYEVTRQSDSEGGESESEGKKEKKVSVTAGIMADKLYCSFVGTGNRLVVSSKAWWKSGVRVAGYSCHEADFHTLCFQLTNSMEQSPS
jgi:hypothetical protein